jgi:hypothetical protein
VARSIRATAVARRRIREKLVGRRDGNAEGTHAAPAGGAVVEVLLR